MSKLKINVSEAIANIKSAIKNLDGLKTSLKTIGNSGNESMAQLKVAMKSIDNETRNVYMSMRKMETAYRNAVKSQKSYYTQTKKLKVENAALNKELVKTKKNLDNIQKSTKKTTTGFKGMMVSLRSLLSGFGLIAGLQIFGRITKNVFELVKTFDGLEFALERVSKSMIYAAESERFLLEISKDFGVELVSTTNRFIKFRAAARNSGMTLKSTQDIFRSMTKAAAVLGLKTDELQGVYLALEQMLSKGKITTEELRRQLGERLPGAMGIMAAAIGKTIPELDKMMKKGQLLSAEVLPKFAKAVEIAYSLDNIERVETLVASQNRLTTAWQNFVKSVFTDSTKLMQFFDGLGDAIDKVALYLGGNEAIKNKAFSDETKIIEKDFKERAEKEIEAIIGVEDAFKKSRERLEQMRIDAGKADAIIAKRNGDDSLDIAIKAETEKLVKLTELRDASIKSDAQAEVKAWEDQYFRQNEQFEKLEKLRDDVAKRKGPNKVIDPLNWMATLENSLAEPSAEDMAMLRSAFADSGFLQDTVINDWEDFNKVLEKAAETVGLFQAEYTFRLKEIEKSDPVSPLDPDGSGSGKMNLKTFVDKELERQKAVLEVEIDTNKALINSDKVTNAERIKLLEDNAEHERFIAKLNFDIKIRDLEKANAEYTKKLNEGVASGKITAGEAGATKSAMDAQDEQSVEIAREERAKAIIAVDEGLVKDLQKINKDAHDLDLALIQSGYDDRIAILKEEHNERVKMHIDNKAMAYDEYAASEKTAKDKSILNKKLEAEQKEIDKITKETTNELKLIAHEAAIAKLQGEVAYREALLQTSGLSKEKIAEIKAEISALKASIGVLTAKGTGGETDEFTGADKWIEALELAADYAAAIGDLFDNIYERRIENINAEIVAEEEKYDKLIALAEGDAEQQDSLRRQKEAKIKILEKERLKEQQKQAKARKVAAVSEIIINTSIATMRAFTDGPLAGIAFASFIAALGALQIATVLAQPIPQYKDGLSNATKDHLGIINDGGAQEYIERDGSILTTNTKNAIVGLKKGDTVHKNFNDMINSQLLSPNGIGNITSINENDFNKLMNTVSTGIEKGFKKAKVNVKINNKTNDYKDSMLNW